MEEAYKKQVSLLLDILPEVANEEAFALHGGTAINLFHLNMPRLSVDIDLTYIYASESREVALQNIRAALGRISERIRKRFPIVHFPDIDRAEEELKLSCTTPNAIVKVEVNQINRGLIAPTDRLVLCEKAQNIFDKFCEIRVVSQKQLWGGKIVAALDRQHPRDLFDVKNLFDNIGYSQSIKEGIIFFLLCSKRPIQELLNPHPIDQSIIFESQFKGMTESSFGRREYQQTRERLIKVINESLTSEDIEFLSAFNQGEPNWEWRDYGKFPAVKWKLLNINKLKDTNPQKYQEQVDALKQYFSKNHLTGGLCRE